MCFIFLKCIVNSEDNGLQDEEILKRLRKEALEYINIYDYFMINGKFSLMVLSLAFFFFFNTSKKYLSLLQNALYILYNILPFSRKFCAALFFFKT